MNTTHSYMLTKRSPAFAYCAAALTCAAFLSGCSSDSVSKGRSDAQDSGFDVAADRSPSPNTLYTMAKILAKQGRTAEAEQLLNSVLQQAPETVPAYLTLAELQTKSGRVDVALVTLHKGLIVAPKEPVLHNNEGMCYVSKANYAAALESFTRAVELDAGVARYRANRAMCQGMLGKYDECLAAYLTVVNAADAHYNLAVLCRMRGDAERSNLEFSRAEAMRNGTASVSAPSPVAASDSTPPATPPPPAAGTPISGRGPSVP